jgi:hypothetical protein
MEGIIASWSIVTVSLSQVPKFGTGPADNEQMLTVCVVIHLLITLDLYQITESLLKVTNAWVAMILWTVEPGRWHERLKSVLSPPLLNVLQIFLMFLFYLSCLPLFKTGALNVGTQCHGTDWGVCIAVLTARKRYVRVWSGCMGWSFILVDSAIAIF